MKTYIPLNGLSGVAIAVLPSIICIQLTFSDGLGGEWREIFCVNGVGDFDVPWFFCIFVINNCH